MSRWATQAAIGLLLGIVAGLMALMIVELLEAVQ